MAIVVVVAAVVMVATATAMLKDRNRWIVTKRNWNHHFTHTCVSIRCQNRKRKCVSADKTKVKPKNLLIAWGPFEFRIFLVLSFSFFFLKKISLVLHIKDIKIEGHKNIPKHSKKWINKNSYRQYVVYGRMEAISCALGCALSL